MCCCSTGCAQTLTFKQCSQNSTPTTVTIKDGGGATVDSGTTSGSGVYVTASLPAGSYTVDATYTGTGSTRLAALTGHAVTFTCPATSVPTINLSPASGYACITGCAIPTKTTLHITFTSTFPDISGPFTLTLSGSIWSVITTSYIIDMYANGLVQVYDRASLSLIYQSSSNTVTCPLSFMVTGTGTSLVTGNTITYVVTE